MAQDNTITLSASNISDLRSALASCKDTETDYIIEIKDNIKSDGKEIVIPAEINITIYSYGSNLFMISQSTAFRTDEGAQAFGLFHVYGNLTLENITVDASANGRCIVADKGSVVTVKNNAVLTDGLLKEYEDMEVPERAASQADMLYDDNNVYGGAVLVNGGTFVLDGGNITGNSAVLGGGIFLKQGTAKILSGSIYSNASTGNVQSAGIYFHHNDTDDTSRLEIAGSPNIKDTVFLEKNAVFTVTDTLGSINIPLCMEEVSLGSCVADYDSIDIYNSNDGDKFILSDGNKCVYDRDSGKVKIGVIIFKNCKVTANNLSYEYTGDYIIPDITVYLNDGTETEDYMLYSEDNITPGTKTATLLGTGLTLSGKLTFNFSIDKIKLTADMITIENSSYVYTGAEIRPTVSVSKGNLHFNEGTDYSVTYKDNIYAGRATVTVEATENSMLRGSAGRTFTITEAGSSLSNAGTTSTGTSNSRVIGSSTSNNSALAKQSITTSEETYTKYLGDAPFSLNAVSDGTGYLTYTSSDEDVVTVSRTGKVTITGCGIADITINAAESYRNASAQSSVKIIVKPGDETTRYTNVTTSGNILVAWNQDVYVTGYQVRYSKNKNMEDAESKTITDWKKNYILLDELENNCTYYIEIRGIVLIDEKTILSGEWNEAEQVEIK